MLNPIFSKKVQGQTHPGRWGIVEHQIPNIKVLFKTNTKGHKHPSIRCGNMHFRGISYMVLTPLVAALQATFIRMCDKASPYMAAVLGSFVEGIHRSTVDSPHKGQCRGALKFSLIFAWTNSSAHNRDAGDLRRHYDVTLKQIHPFVYVPLLRMIEAICTWACFVFRFGKYRRSDSDVPWWRHDIDTNWLCLFQLWG